MSRAAELMASAVRMERTAATADEFDNIERLKRFAFRLANDEAQRIKAPMPRRPDSNASLIVLPRRP